MTQRRFERPEIPDAHQYRRMKDVSRHSDNLGWLVMARWGPAQVNDYFADSGWGGVLGALVAANAFAADCYIALDKPITTRMTRYPGYCTNQTGVSGVYQRVSGTYFIKLATEPNKDTYIALPKETTKEEAISLCNEMRRNIHAASPIRFFR